MKTYKIILLAISMMGLLISTACSSDDVSTLSEPTPTPIETGVPAWLIGEYKSIFYPNDDSSFITEESMHLNFAPFEGPVLFYYMNDVDSEVGAQTYTIHYDEDTSIVFQKSDIPASTDIKISLIDNDVIHVYGLFNRVFQ